MRTSLIGLLTQWSRRTARSCGRHDSMITHGSADARSRQHTSKQGALRTRIIGIAAIALSLCVAEARAEDRATPDATLRLSGRSVAGIAFVWERFTLSYKGNEL
jgi:hypothetical protein